MAKWNRPVPLRGPDTRTAEGGPGFTRDPKDELFTLGLANMVDDDTFYETASDRDARFLRLVRDLATSDPDWTRSYIVWLRSEGQMRSAPIVATAEYVATGAPNGRGLVARVLQRPDEPAELIGYWHHKHPGKQIPKPIKRGIADALGRLYTERNVLKYDGTGNTIRFGDVVELVHPDPRAVLRDPPPGWPEREWLEAKEHRVAHRSALYRHLIDRRHGRGDTIPEQLATLAADRSLMAIPPADRRAHLGTAVQLGWDWKRIAGWVPGGMDKAAWEAAIPNMGLMALVRNLRNFDQAGVDDRTALEVTRRMMDAGEVTRSRQFPLRFLTAWKATTSMRWAMGLEAAINHSLANVPTLTGRTLVLVDVSPSMRDKALSRRTDGRADTTIQPQRWEVAGLFGAALAKRAEKADVVLFDFNPLAQAELAPAESVLRFVEQCGQWADKSSGTDILRALAETYNGHDRVVILTDEQQGYTAARYPYRAYTNTGPVTGERFGWDDVAHIKVPVFTFNLGGYAKGVTPNERNWHTYGGLSDAAFKLIPTVEAMRFEHTWPWELDLAPYEEVEVEA